MFNMFISTVNFWLADMFVSKDGGSPVVTMAFKTSRHGLKWQQDVSGVLPWSLHTDLDVQCELAEQGLILYLLQTGEEVPSGNFT